MAKKNGFEKLLALIFKISFRAMNFCENDNEKFGNWCRAKNFLNYRLNRAVFKHLGQRGYPKDGGFDHEMENQFVLDAISEMIDVHFKYRYKIYHLTKIRGVPHERFFILVSFIYGYCREFANILNCFKNLGSRFKLSTPIDSNLVCLAINFPSHSFSIPDRALIKSVESDEPFSSFGEFLLHYVSVNGGRTVLSLDEYARHSKNMGEQAKTPNEVFEKAVKTFPRITIKRSRSILGFFVDFGALAGWASRRALSSFWKTGTVLEVKRLYKFIESIKYTKLISHLATMEKQVDSIFLLPFNSLGDLKYDRRVSEKTSTYNYGDNFFIAPASKIQEMKTLNNTIEIKKFLSEVSLSSLKLTGRAIGFTDIFYFLDTARKAINDKYGCSLPNRIVQKIRQRSAVLGYETEGLKLENSGYKSITVFDVPPDGREHQLSRALIGDWTCDHSFIEEFWLDIANFVLENNVRVLFKPKYSLSNYSVEYRLLIDSIQRKLTDRFVVMYPYVRIGPMFELAEVCLSFPYTSTRSIGEEFGRPSFYYVPECYRAEFETNCPDSKLLIGRSELAKHLASCPKSAGWEGSLINDKG